MPHAWGRKFFYGGGAGPLRRFLESRAGRPWDKVYAEVCDRADRGGMPRDEVRGQLGRVVALDVVLLDGVPCHRGGRSHGEPLAAGRWAALYVCPRTGLLRRAPRPAAPARPPAPPPDPIPAGGWQVCCWADGGWDLVTLEPLPPEGYGPRCTDPGRWADARRQYGKAGREVARRRLVRRELKSYPIPIDLWDGPRAGG